MIVHGPYTDLADRTCDALIADPPYGAGTHSGHNVSTEQPIYFLPGRGSEVRMRQRVQFDPWTPDDVRRFVDFWSPRTLGWMAVFTSHDLIGAYQDAYRAHGRYAFAPVSVIIKHCRLLGDGPASWTTYLMVARPRSYAYSRWRCLPGSYDSKLQQGAPIGGVKTLDLMRQIVRDYSNPGDTVCDPCAGWGSTLLAAREMGRRAFGAELDQATCEAARVRLGLEQCTDRSISIEL